MAASRVLYSRSLEALTHLVASSAYFQELTGTADEAAALAYVNWPYALDGNADRSDPDSEPLAPFPRAIVDPIPKYELTDHGAKSWHDTGAAMVSFEFEPTADYASEPDTPAKAKARMDEFLDRVFTVVYEMAANSGEDRPSPETTSYLRVRKFQLVDMGEAVDEDEGGRKLMGAVFVLEW